MGDLYLDDIEDQRTYPDEMVLRDVRAILKAVLREGPTLDYKADVSEKDNWPEAAASFANVFGGLIVFGVEGKGDQPRRLTGFDPKGVEIKTKLGSMLLSRIQPRPDFQICVVTFDQDPTKEVAILRVSEGLHPPYMHSKGEQHRVYVRVGAQKAEADYLQLTSLFERSRKIESRAAALLGDLTVGGSQVLINEPGENRHSSHWYRFLLAPDDDRAARRLTLAVEHQFTECIEHMFGHNQGKGPVIRNQAVSIFPRGADVLFEHRFAVTPAGSLAFISRACLRSDSGDYFVPVHLCWDLIAFLCLAALFYESAHYYGSCLLAVALMIPDAQLFPGLPARDHPNGGSRLFEPELERIQANGTTQLTVVPHSVTAERLKWILEEVVNDLVRTSGTVLSSNFSKSAQWLIEDAVERYDSRRT
jgi:Putative DNA-binding domain